MGILRTLFIIVLVYYFLKILGKVFGPILFKHAAKKMEKRYNQRYNDYQPETNAKAKEGETVIDKQPEPMQKRSKEKEKAGEYIDFEEID
ncbi:DUF4834 family protein [Leptobacterium sp. I13]|uniref:DUF4834 family protein n=1 Tax=Leptobacterium meishanense TaxID=3128904 RepID=UPI0030EEE085